MGAPARAGGRVQCGTGRGYHHTRGGWLQLRELRLRCRPAGYEWAAYPQGCRAAARLLVAFSCSMAPALALQPRGPGNVGPRIHIQ